MAALRRPSLVVELEKISSAPTSEIQSRYKACKAMARGYAQARKTDRSRLAHARSFCAIAIHAYWNKLCAMHGTSLKMKPCPIDLPSIAIDAKNVANIVGGLVVEFPKEDAGYLIGTLYTGMLPEKQRTQSGVYYTPPPLVARLLDMAEQAGFNMATGSALDPACGGGAFLAPLAMRMIAASPSASPEWTLKHVAKRLRGIEIDPFAAWMSNVLLEAAALKLCIAAKRRMPEVITVGDTLEPRNMPQFDLVIGNPPYGKVTLGKNQRQRFARSLFGHANLYGLFTDLAMQWVRPGGVLAYLTPTSFLGGQYFKALRHLLTHEMSPRAFDFVADRNGVFEDVLQETLLAVYVKTAMSAPAQVSMLIPHGLNDAVVEALGEVNVDIDGAPWRLPRKRDDAGFVRQLDKMPTRLLELGYSVSTGPLVWNRHKNQLRQSNAKGFLPLLWAESITAKGFEFSAARRGHVPFIEIDSRKQAHLITRNSAVLVQRTTSKEQERRLLAAVLPQTFINEHHGVVIENHLNVIYVKDGSINEISAETISMLLNSAVVDRAFRCISGSVAVSAYELNSLPLPTRQQLLRLQKMIEIGVSQATIERQVAKFYGIGQ